MNCKYEIEKQKIDINKIKTLEIFFDNGDYVTIQKNEIVSFNATFYDRLIIRDDEIHPVIKEGILKLKINPTKKNLNTYDCVFDRKEYINNRKEYIENRCVNHGEIDYIKVYDQYNWSHTYFGYTKATIENNELIISYIPLNDDKSDSKYHYIMLNNIKKDDIRYISLDFENCDGVDIYGTEIVDMNLNYSHTLYDCSGFIKQLTSGYMLIKLDKEDYNRNVNTYTHTKDKEPYISIMNRVCYKNKVSTHDICNLYIHYFDGRYKKETVTLKDIRSPEELKEAKKLEESGKPYDEFVGGYSIKINDNTFLITFGQNAKHTLYKLLQNTVF